MSLGTNLKDLRKKKGLTQTEIARQLGIKQPSYLAIEKDQADPSFKTLLKLIEIFNTTPNDILGIENQNNLN